MLHVDMYMVWNMYDMYIHVHVHVHVQHVHVYMLYMFVVVVDMCMYRAVHMRHRDTCDT